MIAEFFEKRYMIIEVDEIVDFYQCYPGGEVFVNGRLVGNAIDAFSEGKGVAIKETKAKAFIPVLEYSQANRFSRTKALSSKQIMDIELSQQH
jgi:hypothetical protein